MKKKVNNYVWSNVILNSLFFKEKVVLYMIILVSTF